MREEGRTVSIAQLCRWFGVPRSTFYYRPPVDTAPRTPVVDKALETQIRAIIDTEPAVGLRMITARIRRAAEAPVSKKKIHRIIKLNQWQCQRRPKGRDPECKAGCREPRSRTSDGPSTRRTSSAGATAGAI